MAEKEYIEREAAVETLNALKPFLQSAAQERLMRRIIRQIGTIPAADVAPVRWAPVVGFEGLYEVCTTGKIRNKKKETMKQGIKRTPCTCYKVVHLWKDGRYYTKYVHRLIAEAFIPNPENLEFINHRDEDGTNNAIDNLEWCTREYNVNYGTALARMAKKIRGRESEKRIAIYAVDADGNFAGEWPSITAAANDVGCSTSEISQVCKGKRKSAKGLIWHYMDLEGGNT
jgi:hypothetical protein